MAEKVTGKMPEVRQFDVDRFWKVHYEMVLALAKVVTKEDIELIKKIKSPEDVIDNETKNFPKHKRAQFLSYARQQAWTRRYD